ncbi:hypothetical protein HELRODRAFT_167080 [Helobdella robusta]|uniref:Uncharacterized protein n=1 Tax=Helobdella robusta TaxID=6412 RepID=T1EYZ9_HELRO|nr:hypothetical protein HELRODRAFT_167080 [Helobdella robusta]ESO10578.1 hypothetical protein HELRODRAFT_167080 [Helobdella robusta]
MLASVKKEIANYAENSTIKGIPKIVKSKDPFMKKLWLFSVLLWAGVLAYLFYKNMSQFFDWPVMTKYGEMVDGTIKFPDITICNLDPFASGYLYELPVYYYFEFMNRSKNELINYLTTYKNTILSDALMVYDEFNSISGYILNLPKKLRAKNSDCPNFITRCNVYFGNSWFDNRNSCLENFVAHWNENYHTCHTLQASKLSRASAQAKGIQLLLNVGPTKELQIPYKNSFSTSQARGVQVSVHSPGTPPNLQRGFSVAPGSENIVTIVQTEKTRLNQPHNKLGCTYDKFLKTSPSERYTKEACIDFCRQENIYREIGCVSHYLNVPQNYRETVDMCGNFSSTKRVFDESFTIKDLNDTVTTNYLKSLAYLNKSCSYNCMNPCHETQYSTYLSSTTWPQFSFQFSLFDAFINQMNCSQTNPRIAERYKKYYDVLKVSSQRNLSLSEVLSNISTSEFTQIQESFLTIKFMIKEDVPYYSRDLEANSWENMVGVTGGMFSMWLGISAATLVELLELVYNILKIYCKSKKEGENKSVVFVVGDKKKVGSYPIDNEENLYQNS